MESQPIAPSRWQADLEDFFGTLDRENDDYSQHIKQQNEFYSRTALPALEAVAEALRRHGRTCETGLDQHRAYVIVRRPEGPVEFQYAVVAEARIEGVTPYIHCWFEENPLAKTSGEDSGKAANEAAQKPADESSNQQEEENEEGDEEKPDDDKKKDDKKPARTKTIELLATWSAGRPLESITQEEVLTDFVAHYKEAVAGLRTHLHAAPPTQP